MIISPAGAPTARSAPSSRPAKHMPMCMSNCKQTGLTVTVQDPLPWSLYCPIMALSVLHIMYVVITAYPDMKQ